MNPVPMAVELVLASNSPRRRELLALGGWTFHVQAANVDETPRPDEPAPAYVRRLAQEKALAVARYLLPLLPLGKGGGGGGMVSSLILAADTTVVDGEEILGKPSDAQEAESMLRRLRGRDHTVYTALAALSTIDGRLLTDLCATQVPMRLYSDEEIRDYVSSGDPLDKAGAYAIQHAGFHPVSSLHGCFANVMGLPLCHLARLLRQMGIEPERSIPTACQAHLAFSCEVYPQILG